VKKLSQDELRRICFCCGFANPPAHTFCGKCGAQLSAETADATVPSFQAVTAFASPQAYTPKHLAEKILTSRAALEGERKQVTVLFADLKGSTELIVDRDPEEADQLLNPVLDRMIEGVHRYEGTVTRVMGDGIMALFGAPLAHEDHAIRACSAALAMQAAIRHYNQEIHHGLASAMQIRVGLNSGEVVVRTIGNDLYMEYTAVGQTAHVAARMEQLAEPGTILMSEATHRLAEDYVDSTFVGEREVKGLAAPQPVYCLEEVKPGGARFDAALRRGLTPFVGRQRELQILEQCCHRATQGALGVVHLVGEAGIGKSRLVHEFLQRLEASRIFFLQGRCTARETAAPFVPFVEVVRALFQLVEREDKREITRKLRQGIESLGLRAEQTLPFLLNLLGLDPGADALRGLDGAIIGARTRDILQELLRKQCQRSPVVLVIDDLHWTDTASEELLQGVIQNEMQLPLLILCAYRSPYRPPWGGHANVTELRLDPLSDEDSLELVQRRLGTEHLPRDLTRVVGENAEGNPLFAEEITRYLQETGSLSYREQNVSFSLDQDVLSLPVTIQGLVLARVDRLTDGPRAVLQIASVIGRRFSAALLRKVSRLNSSMLSQHLRNLEAHELIFRQDGESLEDYRFKHSLIQTAVYETLLTTRRDVVHQEVGEAIEGLYPDQLGEWAEVLAYHYSHTARVEKAACYLVWSGEKSLRVYSLEEAHRFYSQAVDLLEAVPGFTADQFLPNALLGWVRVYYYRKDFKAIIDLVERYRSRVQALGDRHRFSLLLSWLGFSHAFAARYHVAKPLLEEALALGEAAGDEECIGYASMALMYAYTSWVRREDRPSDIVDRLGNRSLEIAESLGDVYLASKCLTCLGIHRIMNGRFNEARDFASKVVELGRGASDPRTVAMGLWLSGFVDVYDERYEEAIENAERALEISPDPLDRLTALGCKGVALTLMGQSHEGLAILQQVRHQMVEADYVIPLLAIDFAYGAAMVLTGQMRTGIRWIENCIERFEQLGNDTQPGVGHMILGEIYLQMVLREQKVPLRVVLKNLGFILCTRPSRKARSHLEEAIARARELKMPGFLARSLLDLGRLCKAKKLQEEFRAYLEEARQIAEPLESPILSEKIQRALEH
jgi:class 3 adenylate cyclase/tetratricopeptide (TPR) repeat protein